MNRLSACCKVRDSIPIVWKIFSFLQYPSRPALLLTNLLYVGTVALPRGLSGRGVALSFHQIHTPRLRRSRPISLLSPCFMAGYGEMLPVLLVVNKHRVQLSRSVLAVRYILKSRFHSIFQRKSMQKFDTRNVITSLWNGELCLDFLNTDTSWLKCMEMCC
jgi:hypothetical protein